MNNKYLFSSILFLIIQTLIAQEFAIGIIPSPNKISILKGIFEINNQTTIRCNSKTKDISILIQSYLKKESKLNLKITHDKKNKKNSILLKIDSQLEKEAYSLNSSKNGIIITGATKAGLFYGFQTLKQLFINSTQIPIVSIKDSPRFKWRAYMLDEARYFHGEEFVKKMLDQMALLKMNVFHWHLTDDAGWRIEIKKYPKLTEIGATRSDSEIGTWKSGKTAGKPHRGFYTQQQIKEIVAYAAKRYITIVPEFEMPGHSSAAIAAYPWLGTVGKAMDVPIKFGRHYDNYDITKPEVEAFVKDVLSELFDLFPSKVIHVGGDEVGYASWNNSKHVQQYMKEKNLNTAADLQIYFMNNISKYIESNGRRMMGWNEIMGINIHKRFEEKKNDKEAETSLAKNVVVHFWKGNLELATQAAKKGYSIVNSLHSYTYLDYDYRRLSLEKAYSFDPIPTGLAKKYHKNVYGLGCQMWSEWTPRNTDVEYQTFPRIAAYVEVGWTNTNSKNFENFKISLKKMQNYWTSLEINYAKVLE